ncbi:hypothetical protein EDB80DRAFT_268897 [Ilyonectria destructans]|nr:hypothetical protein EDB80DRAFT_268897 [Ilyonectria destructans]
MSYFLPPQGLQQLWDHILAAVRQPGLQDFRDPELFMEAKGTKLLFKYPDAPSDLLAITENFDSKLHHVLEFSHICSDRFYIDVGKEACPPHSGAVISTRQQCFVTRSSDLPLATLLHLPSHPNNNTTRYSIKQGFKLLLLRYSKGNPS